MTRSTEDLKTSEELPARPQERKSSSLKRDAAFTTLAQFTVAIATYFQYMVIRKNWGTVQDFASYSQLFRVRNYAEWIVLLVIPTALAKQIAAYGRAGDEKAESVYTWTGLATALALVVVTSVVARLIPAPTALALFGNADMADWVAPFCNLLGGYAMALVVLALLRGYMRFRLANLLLICYTGISPLAVPLLLRGAPLMTVVSVSGYSAGVLALLFFLLLVKVEFERAKPVWAGVQRHWAVVQDLVSYGAPRIITIACTSTLTLILPWYANYQNDTRLVASLNSVLLVLGGAAIFVGGMSFVLLPRLSSLLADGHSAQARRQLGLVIEFTVSIGGLGAMASTGILGPFLRFWVGTKIEAFPVLVASSSLAIPTLLILEIMRGPIDAVSRIPWNALTYGVGSFISLALIWFLSRMGMPLATVLSVALVASYFIAATVALAVAHKLYGLEISASQLGLNVVVIVGALAFLFLEELHASSWMLIYSLGACALYVAITYLMKPAWISELMPSRFKQASQRES